jgi:hypothetical protein
MSDLLNAAHLAVEEESVVAFGLVPEDLGETEFTFTNAVERLRRIAYHQGRIRDIDAQLFDLVEPLRMELERLTSWAEDAQKAPEASIAHHESWLRLYYERNLPVGDEKHIKLPNGRLNTHTPPPKWEYADESVVTTVLSIYRPELVRVTEAPDKVALKAAATVQDGKVYIADDQGELHELPIAVVEQPAKFTVKVTGGAEK